MKSIQSLGSEYTLRTNLKFPDISYFTDLRQTKGGKNIQKTVSKTKLKIKETTYTLIFVKYLVVSFWSPSTRAFSVFLKDSLRIISGIWRAGKNIKTDSDSPSFFQFFWSFLGLFLNFLLLYENFLRVFCRLRFCKGYKKVYSVFKDFLWWCHQAETISHLLESSSNLA
jgi:hypothetical protein